MNCHRNYPWYRGWSKDFKDRDFRIIGVHTPETEAERDAAAVRRKVAEAGFDFPVALDNGRTIWNAWGNSMWPSVYLIDKQGQVRSWWYGELNWQGAGGDKIMRQRIEQLLGEE